MPSFASALGDAEVASIASFVAKRWGQDTHGIEEKEVANLRSVLLEKGSFAGGQEIAEIVQGLPAQPTSAARSEATLDPNVARLMFQGGEGVWACAACHGDLAQGKENTPRLAGLPAQYIEKQLHDFRIGNRGDETMMFVAKNLTDKEMSRLATYLSGLRVGSTAHANLSGDLKRGETLALKGDWSLGVPACFTCHGAAGFGVAPGFPALAAQQAPYTATQLAAWAGGRRTNSPLGLMEQISKALSTDDRRAVADYLATLAPVPAVDFNEPKQEMSNAGRTGEP
jgi:cytochrome c553